MNNEDLLYTNEFVRTGSVSREQLEQDANNFVPYRTLKEKSNNDVREELERNILTNNPINQEELRAYGWNRGSLGNQRPVLSDFSRDIGTSSYFRYKTSYVNIDSRMRDVSLYPRPNNYKIFLGKKYQNVESIKIEDYFIPITDYPINVRNNVIMWFTIPNEMILQFAPGITDRIPSLTYNTGNIPISSFETDFNLLGSNLNTTEDVRRIVRNNIYKSLFEVMIPPGNYTTEELAIAIEQEMGTQQFFNSELVTSEEYEFKDPDSETKKFYRKPQKVKAVIDPINSNVQILLRYEELKVEYVKSYNNKNYFDVELRVETPGVSSEEYLDLIANEIYPIVFTGMPELGSLEGSYINMKEFLPLTQILLINDERIKEGKDIIYKTYYDKVIDQGTGQPVPNVLRFFMYNFKNKEVIFSYGEKIEYDGPCKLLCDLRLGREAPYFFLSSLSNPLTEFIKINNNNIYGICPEVCKECDPFPDKDIGLVCENKRREDPIYVIPVNCNIVENEFLEKLSNQLCNIDGSSRILVNLLGFFNTLNNRATLGFFLYGRGLQSNFIDKSNEYINMVESLNIIDQEADKFLDCEDKLGKENKVYLNYNSLISLDYELPICKGSEGKYYFYFDNYVFLKLLESTVTNTEMGENIEQIKPTSNFGNGTSDVYKYGGNLIRGYKIEVEDDRPETVGDCQVPNGGTETTFENLTKDITNIFAKIRLPLNPGSCEVNTSNLSNIIYYGGSISNFDEFLVQFVDYEGKILELKRDHNFTLKIVEKIEILKETNINSRTGYVNIVGSK